MTPAADFWPGCGFQALARDARGWLVTPFGTQRVVINRFIASANALLFFQCALCVVLALTPLRVAFAVPALARWRRMLGLFAFAWWV